MIVKHRTLPNLTKIVVKAAGNSQQRTFAPSAVLDQKTKKLVNNTKQQELCLNMIVEHRTLLNLTKILVKAAGNSQHGTFSSCVVQDQETKKLIKNTEQSELCLEMTVEHRTLLTLTKIIVKAAGISQHGTFAPSVVIDQMTKILINNTQQPELSVKMIVQHRTLLNLVKIIVKAAGNSQQVTFAPSVVLEQNTKKLINNT